MIEKGKKLLWLVLSLFVRCVTHIHTNRVLCWSYGGKKYSCNPYYITKYLLEMHPGEFDIYWYFESSVDISSLPKSVKIVRKWTWKYLWIVNTSKFLITNSRISLFDNCWVKKKGQKYIMTWHSSMGIKRIEKDAEQDLNKGYIRNAKYDSKICDLILSGCRFRTNVIKRAFWYNGEILEQGTPRNDMLFNDKNSTYKLRNDIYEKYFVPKEKYVILYAPTFRKDLAIDHYRLSWKDIVESLELKFKKKYVVFLRLHPNMLNSNIDISCLMNYPDMRDVTLYHDMQELLAISDILITDYSSSIFDFSLLLRPCFIYASDYESYDRGTYLQMDRLPYPFAMNERDLIDNIRQFSMDKYISSLRNFQNNIIGSYEKGVACESFYKWMIKQ